MNTPRQLASSFLTPPSSVHRRGNYSICFSLRRSHLCGAALSLFALSSSLFAAPPPELTVLRQQYDKVVAERVTAPFEASKAALETKFTTALTNAITTAKQSGKLDDVLAIQDDQKRLADKIPLPDDNDTTPASLKTLRAIYREQLKKLEDTRTANHTALLPAYTAKLTDLEATLVKNDRIEEAKELRKYREDLVTGDLTASTAPASIAPVPSPPSNSTAIKREIAVIPPEKEREVALEMLKIGPVEINAKTADGREVTITSAVTLPAGDIQIVSVKVLGVKEGKARAGKMLAPLAGLPALNKLILQHFPLHDDDMNVIGALPALKEFHLEFSDASAFTGKTLHLLAAPEKLTQMNLSGCSLTRPAFLALEHCINLVSLDLGNTTVTDDDLKHLASLIQLKSLNLEKTGTSISALRHLKNLTLLEKLGWSPDPKSEKGGFPEVAALFPNVIRLQLSRRQGAKAEHYAGISAMPNLRHVHIRGDGKPGIILEAVANAPQIEELSGYLWDGVQDTELVPLQTALGISTVRLEVAGSITAKGLMHLSKMPKLKQLTLRRFSKLTEADIEVFRKNRPDVKVEFSN